MSHRRYTPSIITFSTNPIAYLRRCAECSRRFDLRDDDQANDWYHGHDCETP